MISTKKHIRQLAAILSKKDISDVIISPGSRNGPLIHTFVGCGKFNCRNIVDERSAAYFAIGLYQATKRPVVLVCSSGTATLNYAPAVAEACYLNIPLIVLTADRPAYWINQGESQCIPQTNIYADFVKRKVNLPLEEASKDLDKAAGLIDESLQAALSGDPGPVHINIPLEEPLHDTVDEKLQEIKISKATKADFGLNESDIREIIPVIDRSEKIMILAGQHHPCKETEKAIADFAAKTGALVLGEHLSNLYTPNSCGNIDAMMATLLNDKLEDFRPDLLISFGGQTVSKSLKQFLRKNKPQQHWLLNRSGESLDTFRALTRVFKSPAARFFSDLTPRVKEGSKQYLKRWKSKEEKVIRFRDNFIAQLDFSDLKVFDSINNSLPEPSVLHLGNSSPVRYALICRGNKKITYLGNRGTSGIDGCLSTAVGYASSSQKINTVILGDLSFFYDSNALWNNYLNNNLRIIVINNGGGNIFSLIKGPSDSPAFNQHFFAANKHKAEGIAKAFELDYYKAENQEELETALAEFYSEKQNKTALLEIFTDAEYNTRVFREYFKKVKI